MISIADRHVSNGHVISRAIEHNIVSAASLRARTEEGIGRITVAIHRVDVYGSIRPHQHDPLLSVAIGPVKSCGGGTHGHGGSIRCLRRGWSDGGGATRGRRRGEINRCTG